MNIEHHIAALLYDHDCVIVTDFGGFITSYKSALWMPGEQTFFPPSKKIAFNTNLKNNDGLLANHISSNEIIPYPDACRLIHNNVEKWICLLREGKQVIIENIGVLFFDGEKNIQFIPEAHQNFLKDSFGMCMIHAPVLKLHENTFAAKTKNDFVKKKKMKFDWHIAELIPVAAVVALMFTFPVLTKNLDQQLGNLDLFNRNDNVEQIIKENSIKIKQRLTTSFDSPFSTEPDKNKNENPVTDSAKDYRAENISKHLEETNAETTVKNESNVELNNAKAEDKTAGYFIITGCFRIRENALKLETELKSKGYDAVIIGKNENGLMMVSISSFNQLPDAKNELTKIQSAFISSAWIYHKK